MLYGDLPVTQSLNLSSAEGAAELGLESEKLELRAGEYKMQSYILYGTAKPRSNQSIRSRSRTI